MADLRALLGIFSFDGTVGRFSNAISFEWELALDFDKDIKLSFAKDMTGLSGTSKNLGNAGGFSLVLKNDRFDRIDSAFEAFDLADLEDLAVRGLSWIALSGRCAIACKPDKRCFAVRRCWFESSGLVDSRFRVAFCGFDSVCPGFELVESGRRVLCGLLLSFAIGCLSSEVWDARFVNVICEPFRSDGMTPFRDGRSPTRTRRISSVSFESRPARRPWT